LRLIPLQKLDLQLSQVHFSHLLLIGLYMFLAVLSMGIFPPLN